MINSICLKKIWEGAGGYDPFYQAVDCGDTCHEMGWFDILNPNWFLCPNKRNGSNTNWWWTAIELLTFMSSNVKMWFSLYNGMNLKAFVRFTIFLGNTIIVIRGLSLPTFCTLYYSAHVIIRICRYHTITLYSMCTLSDTSHNIYRWFLCRCHVYVSLVIPNK